MFRQIRKLFPFSIVGLAILATAAAAATTTRPNILWIVVEDMSPHFGCYGEQAIETPYVDALAKAGVQFSNAFVTGPVCSASRSALITGMYQTSIGAHHHRSGRGQLKLTLPDKITPLPVLFRQAGYYVANGDMRPPRSDSKIAKTDYNFTWGKPLYDGPFWSGRAQDRPFFAQIQLDGGKLRERAGWPQRAQRQLGSRTRAEQVTLPPYLPADPVLLNDWADYLDTVRYTDWQVDRILSQLAREGLAENTYVFFFTDHGISHVRAKQFCYDAGLHIPLIVRGPGLAPGQIRTELIEHIDIAAMSLGLAGIAIPSWMQARDMLSPQAVPRQYVHAARDRCDETVDRIRSVRTSRYKYIRNFFPQRPYLQPNAYKDHKEIVRRMRELNTQGKLDEFQSLIMAETRPAEELYDLDQDPHELHNVATDPAYQRALIELRGELAGWIAATGDRGQQPEPAAVYASDMREYLTAVRPADPKRAEEIEANMERMHRWESSGR